MTIDGEAATGPTIEPPVTGLAAMRIGVEFGGAEDFSASFEHALAKSGERGATLVVVLDRGDIGIHVPGLDGPSWNTVPLFHVAPGHRPATEDWTRTSEILEKLER